MSQYIVNGLLKMSEVDLYNEGCLPETAQLSQIDITFKGDSPLDVLNQLREFFGVEKDAVILNSCGEIGRIDIQLMENRIGEKAGKFEVGLWKKGKRKLWAATYTGFLLFACEVDFEDHKNVLEGFEIS